MIKNEEKSLCDKCRIGEACKKVGRICGIFENHKDEKDWKCPYFEKIKGVKKDG